MARTTPNKTPKVTAASENKADSVLETGKCYTGVLHSVNVETGHCNVRLNQPPQHLENCYWAAGAIFSPLLGFKLKMVPAIGTKVMVLYGNPSFVIQMLPSEQGDSLAGAHKTTTGATTRKDSGVYGNGCTSHSVTEANVLEGEFDLSNAFGVGLLFLNNVMTMKAGDRAKIETHLLRDMVRIVSETFEHVSPLGIKEIYNDGFPNEEESLSSYEFEVHNRENKDTPKAAVSGNKVDFTAENDYVSQFKHRYRKYKGWLGDFLHTFITDPAQSASAVLSGKASIKVGNDGSIMCRSVSSISFERRCRIVVPKRLEHHDSPDGNKSDETEELPEEPLVEWDPKNPHHAAYQLREYACYLANFKELARFRQMNKDFEVPKESDVPAPDPNNKEEDRKKANPSKRFINTYSCIRLMQDGSTIIHDGYGACYYSGRGVVQISSPYAVHIDTGGDFVVVANNTFIKSLNNTEITSVKGGITFKSRRFLNWLCEKGNIWFKSDAKDTDSNAGIILDAPHNRIVSISGGDNMVASTDGDVVVKADKGSVFVKAFKFLKLDSLGNLFVRAKTTVALMATNVYQLASNTVNIQNRMVVSRNSGVKTRGTTEMSGSLKVAGAIYGPPTIGQATILSPPHLNHIRVLEETLTSPFDSNVNTTSNSMLTTVPSIQPESIVKGMVWKFDAERHPQDDSLYQYILPHSQDFIETHSGSFTEFVEWKFSDDKLLEATRTDATSLPWPGKTVINELYHPVDKGHPLTSPSPEENWTQTDLTPRPASRRVLD
jgi:hypothetical protein